MDLISHLGQNSGFIWISIEVILFLLLLFLASFNLYRKKKFPNKYSSFINSNFLFLVFSSLFILIGRLPTLILGSLSPDEDLWMAGGATIWDDPRFWYSFDPTTSGPLIELPIVLIKILRLQITYASVRLAALLVCIIPGIVFLFFSFKIFFNEIIARVIILPLILLMSFVQLNTFIVYNSEHIPFLLTGISLFLFSKIYRNQSSSYFLYFLFGLILGCFPFSKLQAVPIGLGFTLVFIITLIAEFLKGNKEVKWQFIAFFLGGLIPVLLVLSYLIFYGIFKDFWLSYIVSNLSYASEGVNGQINEWMKFKYFIYLIRTISDSKSYFISLLFTSISVIGFLFILKRREIWDHKFLFLLAITLMFTSYYGIVKTSNFYEHYFILFLIPVIFFYGTVMGVFQKSFINYKAYHFIIGFFVATTLIIPSYFCFTHSSFLNLIQGDSILKKDEVAILIEKNALPGEKLAIWGWKTDLYIQCGLKLGTRYGDSFHQLKETDLQSYYIDNYLIDLERNKPRIFVDAITPNAYFFNENKYLHENYLKIDAYIKGNYRILGVVDQIRIYIRN